MGRIKTKNIKKAAFAIVERYPDMFTNDFEKNKEEVKKLDLISNKKIRNKVTGHIAHVVRKKSRSQV